MTVFNPEIETRVLRDQDREDSEGGGDLVELEPVVHIIGVVDGAGGEVWHHVELGCSSVDGEDSAQTNEQVWIRINKSLSHTGNKVLVS